MKEESKKEVKKEMKKEERTKLDPIAEFESSIKRVLEERKRPLLIMYYSGSTGEILREDVNALESVMDDFLEKKEKDGFTELDLLIHTRGGDANTSYRLIQLIRSYVKKLHVLVPEYAHSGGTLISFGADVIEMGRSATLSPIDLQLSNGEKQFALLAIEKYIEFVKECSNICEITEQQNKTGFSVELVKELIKEVGPSSLGDLFRLRSMTEVHAKTLLHNYMFRTNSNKKMLADNIVSKFSSDSPTHSFEMDFNLACDIGLNVIRIDKKINKDLRRIISLSKILENAGVICKFFDGSVNRRRPFICIFDKEVV